MSAREDAQFARGELGADGLPIEEARDEAELQRGEAVEALARNRAYLGREMLTWLLWRSNDARPVTSLDDEPITALVTGRVTLRGLAGEATELAVKGHLSAYSHVVRNAIARGLLVHAARIRLLHGEKAYEVTIDAENLDFRAADIPKVLSEEEDDKLSERLYLVERLTEIIDAVWERFIELRTSRRWGGEIVPEILAWAGEE